MLTKPVFGLPFHLLAAALGLATAVHPVWAALQLDTPGPGWQVRTPGNASFTQAVHYPAASVNTPENQARSAMIRAHIDGLPKAPATGNKRRQGSAPHPEKPATLIVNGIAMPQRVDESGEISRPYSFGRGSNSVEIRHQGQTVRSQFYATQSSAAPARLRVVLSWDSDMTDLDLHVVSPDGQHCFYGNRVVDNGGALDVDVTTGYGPEIYANPNPPSGTYLVYVNYYGSGPAQTLTVARVSIIQNENTAHERVENIDVPMRKPGELTLIRRFQLD